MNQSADNRQSYKTPESVWGMFYHSCLGKIIIACAVILVLLVIAYFTAPSERMMNDEMMDNIVQCMAENDSLKTDNLDDAVNNVGFIFTRADSAAVDSQLINAFYKYNRLESKRYTFYSESRIYNNFRPEGIRVGIGLFTVVIPTVNYNDLLLRVGPIHKGYGNKLIKSGVPGEYYGENPAVREFHYKGDSRD